MYDKSGNYDGKVLRFTDGFFIRNEEDSRYLRECPLFSPFNENPLISISAKDASFPILLSLLESELATSLYPLQHASLQNLVHNFMILSERKFEGGSKKPVTRDPIKEMGQKFIDEVEAGFRKHPKMLVDERVNLEAKRLLLFSRATVKEVSFEVGFDEVTNFVKYFKKHSGTTPSEFRSKYQS